MGPSIFLPVQDEEREQCTRNPSGSRAQTRMQCALSLSMYDIHSNGTGWQSEVSYLAPIEAIVTYMLLGLRNTRTRSADAETFGM